MWQIVVFEFRYTYKLILFVVTLIIAGVLAYLHVRPTAGIDAILLPLSVAIPIQILIFRSIEKRERQQALLPVSTLEIALARVFLFLVWITAVYGSYMVLHLTVSDGSPIWRHDFYDLMMFFGLTLFGFSAFFISHDFCCNRFNNFNAAEFDVVILLVLISVVLLGIPLAMTTIKAPANTFLRVVCFVAGLLLVYPAVLSFTHRKSFLE